MRGKNTQTLWFQIFRKKMLETTHWFKSWGKGTMHLWLQLLKKETFRHHSQIFLHNGEKTHQCIICDMKQHFQSVREEKKNRQIQNFQILKNGNKTFQKEIFSNKDCRQNSKRIYAAKLSRNFSKDLCWKKVYNFQ